MRHIMQQNHYYFQHKLNTLIFHFRLSVRLFPSFFYSTVRNFIGSLTGVLYERYSNICSLSFCLFEGISPRLIPVVQVDSGNLLPEDEYNPNCRLEAGPGKCLRSGDEGVNHNAGLASLHTVLVREHNR